MSYIDEDEVPEGTSEEHLRFMNELVENIRAMTGGKAMVAALGNEPNGVYAVMISVNPLPPELVMMVITTMINEKILAEMGKQHNAKHASGSSYVN